MNTRLALHLEFDHLLRYVQRAMLITDRTRTIIACNDLAGTCFKKRRNELIGQKLEAIIPETKLHNEHHIHISRKGKRLLLHQCPMHDGHDEAGMLIIIDDQPDQLLQQTIDKYENALNQLSECILGVDDKGNVNFLSRSYANLLGIDDPNSVIGKHCTEVVENTRMHIVIQTGETEIGHLMKIGGKTVLATRIPIFQNGKITGAIGKIMFHDVDEFKALANRVQEMESKIAFYEKEMKRIRGAKYSFQSIVGNSAKIREVKNNAQKVARSRSTVLIKGETGTGKELFAHAIHLASPRSAGPFIPVNCAAIPKELLEAELFGYESGAFTGAKKTGKQGKFELANNGTLFLDEIGDLPLDMQAKLLRALERKEIERIGGTTSKKIDVRIIAATNQDLWEMTREGSFRDDLYYRLNVFMLDIPSLRERKEDIIPIASHLMQKLNGEMGVNVTAMNGAVQQVFLSYHWPGNIRELENVLERSMNVVENDGLIQMHHLPVYLRKRRSSMETDGIFSLKNQMEEAEKRAILKALEKTEGNRQKAAKLLGIHRASLYRKIEKYGIMDE
ncbi:sigma 54-interacting transcriptional regulator [Siminovitchia sp. 179-K 8D1 HS]|uniref:sigma 54-interacting transcriptional regulator n=1 Tax=Siminovitchia sp. 179-K 8D1 HS TaxID=3142385 RepID=UPI00399F140D